MRRFHWRFSSFSRIPANTTPNIPRSSALQWQCPKYQSSTTAAMSDPGGQVAGGQPDYSTWSTPSLIARIKELEHQLQLQSQTSLSAEAPTSTASHSAPPLEQVPPVDTKAITVSAETAPTNTKKKNNPPPPDDFTRVRSPLRGPKEKRDIDPSKYNTRFIALKFAYLGQR